VPLRTGGYGVGLISHHDGRGGVIGHFFGRSFTDPPALADVQDLEPQDRLRVMRFGDLGLVMGQWIVLGRSQGWAADDWPMPAFGRRDLVHGPLRVEYEPGDLRGPARELPVSESELAALPRDALSGAGAVELVLTDLLATTG
jgi:hypothetical protein